MEWLEELGYFFAQHGDKLIAILGIAGGSTVGGITVWKLGNIILKLIKKAIEKHYTKRQEEFSNKVLARLDEIESKFEASNDNIKNAFNEIEEKKQDKKNEIYEQIYNGKQKVEEITQTNETEIANLSEVKEEVKEVIKEEVIEQIKPNQESKTTIAMGD